METDGEGDGLRPLSSHFKTHTDSVVCVPLVCLRRVAVWVCVLSVPSNHNYSRVRSLGFPAYLIRFLARTSLIEQHMK